MKGLVSVIIPVYNVQDYLEQCLSSVIDQTYKNLEIIVINDGSTDDSSLICQRYADQDSRITFISTQNQGVSVARNTGLGLSTGEFITFIDADDFVDSDYIESLVSHTPENIDLTCCNLPLKSRLHEKTLTDSADMASLFCESGYTWGKLIRRSCITVGFHSDIWYAEDFIFYIHLLGKLRSIKTLSNNGYHYRIRAGSLSVKDKTEKHSREEFLRKNKLVMYHSEINHIAESYDKKTRQIINSHYYYIFCLLLLLFYRLKWQAVFLDKRDKMQILRLMKDNYVDFLQITGWENRNFKRFFFGSFMLAFPSVGAKIAAYMLD